jgi:Fe2+ transport system protein FeoA
MTRLSILPTGARARVVLLAPELRDRADRLASLGIFPGSEVELVQRLPAYVVEAGETRLAIDADVAQRIFVQRVA